MTRPKQIVTAAFLTIGLFTTGCGPTVEPTPIGIVGEVADFRDRLPEWATDRPRTFTQDMADNAKSQTFDLDDGGKVRLTVWSAADGNVVTFNEHPQIVAAFGVEVRENPNGSHVSWRIIDDSKLDQALVFEVRSEWVERGTRREWLFVGEVGAATKWRFKERDSVLPP